MKKDSKLRVSRSKKIWIDFDNSPHVPFFRPIVARLEERGYIVLLTARQCFQVCELADNFNMQYKSIGHYHGKNKIIKLLGLVFRAMLLAPTVLREKPKLAVSHGSRAQVILARILGIPCVVLLDYEYAKWIPFMKPTWAIAPEVIPDTSIKLNKMRILRYPGIKEDVYVPYFKPDPNILNEIGLNGEGLAITIRPPATEAHYHNRQGEKLFTTVMDFLGAIPNNQLVLLPRTDKQTSFIRKKWPIWSSNGKIIIPNRVVNGLNLIWHSDLVISGGGTMNREAAALGVPVYSIFRGKIGAVDEYLAKSGRLVLLENVKDVRTKILLKCRHRPSKPQHTNNCALHKIVDNIVTILEG